jgi:hypothetical protein
MKPDEAEMAPIRAMQALQRRLHEVQRRVEQLTCEVGALRRLLDPEKAAAFEGLVAEIGRDLARVADEAERNERLRQAAEDAKTKGH